MVNLHEIHNMGKSAATPPNFIGNVRAQFLPKLINFDFIKKYFCILDIHQ